MKKVILGCTLMICGVIGGTGWLLAVAFLAGPGALASITDILPLLGEGKIEGYIAVVFYIIALVGVVLTLNNLGETSKK